MPLSDWLYNDIKNGLQPGMYPDYEEIERKGKLLTKEEKRALGIRTNIIVGQDYIDILTDKGIKNVTTAGYILLMKYFHHNSRMNELKKIIKLIKQNIGNGKIEISDCNDGADCECIKNLNTKVFNMKDLPKLPLTNCDSEYCRCRYSIYF